MKTYQFISALLIIGLSFSCSSDDDDDMVPPPNNDVTYTNTIKAIMDVNCNSCHGDPTSNNAPMSLTTSALVESAVRTRNLIGRVQDGTMPPNGTLSAGQIQAIKDWQANGYK